MSYQFKISEIGLRLIKAYEGYSPKGQILRGGRTIVGYGRVTGDLNAKLSEKDAEKQLRSDLADVENIVNTNVHAAMSQGQFDALCSLAYSIGAEAFLHSDVLHAMNRGEIIKAANGFDGWRLGQIDDQVYVVDALVRRRTAEKALFLRPNRTVPAPHQVLPALKDETATTEQVAQVSSAPKTASNIVPLYQNTNPLPPEIGPQTDDAEIVELTNRVDPDQATDQSPIAEAAAEVSDRLDALMDKDHKPGEGWPESLVEDDTIDVHIDNSDTVFFEENDVVDSRAAETHGILETEFDDDGRYASADKYIEPAHPSYGQQNFWAYITMTILGLTMAGGGLWARMSGNLYFGDLSRLAWSALFAIGFLMFVMGLYYLFKQIFGKS